MLYPHILKNVSEKIRSVLHFHFCLPDGVYLHQVRCYYILHKVLWRHDNGTLSILMALCERNPPVTGGFPSEWTCNAKLWCLFLVGLSKLSHRSLNRLSFETINSVVSSFVSRYSWLFAQKCSLPRKGLNWNDIDLIIWYAVCARFQSGCLLRLYYEFLPIHII